jgi:hypothetical protein
MLSEGHKKRAPGQLKWNVVVPHAHKHTLRPGSIPALLDIYFCKVLRTRCAEIIKFQLKHLSAANNISFLWKVIQLMGIIHLCMKTSSTRIEGHSQSVYRQLSNNNCEGILLNKNNWVGNEGSLCRLIEFKFFSFSMSSFASHLSFPKSEIHYSCIIACLCHLQSPIRFVFGPARLSVGQLRLTQQ